LGPFALKNFCGRDTRVESSMIDPGQFFNNNVVNGIALLDVMRETGCNRMIFSSSAAIYGEPQYNPVDENHPKLPVNPYGESKLMFEKILNWPTGNLAGIHNSQNWKRSSPQPGNGIGSIRMGISKLFHKSYV